MAQTLASIAQQNNIDAFYGLLEQDPYILDRIDAIPFVQTPLHTAASAGSTHFASEILRLKPSFGKKLNLDGLSALDLALRGGHTQTVRGLIKQDPQLIRVQGKRGITPLHYVAEAEDGADLLAEFLYRCPESIEDLTIAGETAVQIAVNSSNLRGLKVLLGWMQETGNKHILEWEDENGNTVLHLAASINNIERDHGGKHFAGNLPYGLKHQILEILVLFSMSGEIRAAFLVVAVLIATATYQAILKPPGGLASGSTDSSTNSTSNSTDAGHGNPQAGLDTPWAGTAQGRGPLFIAFIALNSVLFVASLLTINCLLDAWGKLLTRTLVWFGICYAYALITILPDRETRIVANGAILGALAGHRWIVPVSPANIKRGADLGETDHIRFPGETSKKGG